MGPRSLKRGNVDSYVLTPEDMKASMGPRSLKRGNIQGAWRWARIELSFNGATLSQAWKPEPYGQRDGR